MIFTDEEREEIDHAFEVWSNDNHLTAAARRKAIDAWRAAYDLGVSLGYSKAAVQEQAVKEAREIFENIFKRDWSNSKINDKARDWLATHPAPLNRPPVAAR